MSGEYDLANRWCRLRNKIWRLVRKDYRTTTELMKNKGYLLPKNTIPAMLRREVLSEQG